MSELNEAVKELETAKKMFDYALNRWRTDEAAYRIKAAECRIQAILYKGGEKGVKEVD